MLCITKRRLARPGDELAHVEMQVLAALGEHGIRCPQGDVTEERKQDGAVATARVDQHLGEVLERRQRDAAQPYECH